jgi:hypothetical protein
VNAQLLALGTKQSGNSAPSVTYPYMDWADTAAGLWKQRNAANDEWVTIGTLGSANLGLAPLASPTFTGTVTIPAGASIAGYAPLASPTFTGTVTAPNINGGPIGGSRNAIINGNPTINQRGYVSGTATSGANQYTLDRWRVVTSGQSITWTDSQNVRTVTAPAGGVEQVIEGINLGTGTYTLSWTGTATATVAGAAVVNGTTVSITGGVDTTVRFSGGTFSLAQLEPGTRATLFERRGIGQELALCQRYYETLGPGGAGGSSTNAAALAIAFKFQAAKRAPPTITHLANYTLLVPGQSTHTATATIIGFVTTTGLLAGVTVSVAPGATGLAMVYNTSSDNISASAEL